MTPSRSVGLCSYLAGLSFVQESSIALPFDTDCPSTGTVITAN